MEIEEIEEIDKPIKLVEFHVTLSKRSYADRKPPYVGLEREKRNPLEKEGGGGGACSNQPSIAFKAMMSYRISGHSHAIINTSQCSKLRGWDPTR